MHLGVPGLGVRRGPADGVLVGLTVWNGLAGTALAATLVLVIATTASGQAPQPRPIRVATYNLATLDLSAPEDRYHRVRTVLGDVGADVYALQEVADRQTLERLFDPAVWDIVIDDQSPHNQDLATVVRHPLRVAGRLDADDGDFLFPHEDNLFFPDRRDVLDVVVEIPGQPTPLHVLNLHLKSRRGGRHATNPRRIAAAHFLLKQLKDRFEGVPFVLLGDFNDNPDDACMNLLETGQAGTAAEIENRPGDYLINLTEPLAAAHLVTSDVDAMAIDETSGRILNVDPGSRRRNMDLLATNRHTGNILFDQILIPAWMRNRVVPGSVSIYTGPAGRGASDHLPVQVDLLPAEGLTTEPSTAPPVDAGPIRIVALLPNPAGHDGGRESVMLLNQSEHAVNLAGWRLRDRGSHTFALEGEMEPRSRKTFLIPAAVSGESAFPLNNSGDEVLLLDPESRIIDAVSYSGEEARSGAWVEFRR